MTSRNRPARPERFRLATADTDGSASALAVRLAEPSGEAGLTFLYLHGFGSNQAGEKATFFRERALAAGLAFCSLDFQGHGESGGSMERLTVSRCLADVERVHAELEARGLGRVVVFGSSMGGLVGLWHAVRRADDVLAGVHLAPAIDLGETIAAGLGKEGLERWRRAGVHRVEHELGTWDLGWSFVEDLESYSSERLAAVLARPALLLQGKHDESVSWRAVVDFATTCRHEAIEVHLFADGDHRLLGQRPRLWRLVTEFLAGRGLLTA